MCTSHFGAVATGCGFMVQEHRYVPNDGLRGVPYVGLPNKSMGGHYLKVSVAPHQVRTTHVTGTLTGEAVACDVKFWFACDVDILVACDMKRWPV